MKITKKHCLMNLVIVLSLMFCICMSTSYAVDLDPPTGGMKVLNTKRASDNSDSVGSKNIVLEIRAEDEDSGVNRIAIANENDLTHVNWINWTDSSLTATDEANTKRINWTLSNSDGYKKVYLIIEDKNGNITPPYNDEFAYQVNYDLKGGSNGPSNGSKKLGVPYTIDSTIPTKTGYDFMGWDTSSNGTTVKYSGNDKYYKNDNLNLYAVWKEKTATLKYNANGHGTAPANVTMKYTAATNAASAITATGYSFNGWNTKANGSGTAYAAGAQVKAANVVPSAITLYAQWGPQNYTISYELNSGSATNVTSYNIETATFTLNNPTRTGYTFLGWSGTGLTGTANQTVTITKGSTGNRSYTANWQANTYTVTFNKQNGSDGSNSVTATYGSNMPSATMPTRTGYTFQGYYDATSGGTQYYKADGTSARTWNKTSATTLYARWNVVTYTIGYTLNSGTVATANPTSYTIESNAITLNNPTRTGYTFAGWSGTGLTGTTNKTVTIAKGSTGNRTYTANWTENSATLSYNANGHGTAPTSSTMKYTTKANAASAITADCYTFTGWNTKADGSGTAYAAGAQVKAANTNPSNITLYAQWSGPNHTWNSGSVTTAATCTANGVKTYTCSVCSSTRTESVAALGHDYSSKTATDTYLKSAATCTAKAVYYYKCSRCTAKGTTTYENGNALGHDWQTATTSVNNGIKSEATCTAAAVYYKKCSRCTTKDTNQYNNVGSALGHNWQTATTSLNNGIKSEATCTAAAVYYKKCSRCTTKDTNQYNNVGSALGHDFTSKTTTSTYLKSNATCTAAALYYFKCSRCNEKGTSTYSSGNALGHTGGTATCTAKPVCTRCNTAYGSALGHAPKSSYETDASQHWIICSRCSTITTAKANHTGGSPTIAHDVGGFQHHVYTYCTVCSRQIGTSLNNCGSFTYSKYTADKHKKQCGLCGYFEYVEHTWGGWTTDTNATCTAAGSRHRDCTLCGQRQTESIAALGHTTPTAYTTDASNHWKVCGRGCGTTVVAKAAHSWNSGSVTTAATCTAAGTRTYTCTVCSRTKTEAIAALGHTGGTATCTAKPVCTRCNTAYGSALGHTTPTAYTTDGTNHWKVCGRGCGTIVVAKAAHSGGTATCTAAKTCTTCGVSYGSALGHDYSSKTTTSTYLKSNATCTAAAVYYYKCSRCTAKGTTTYSSGSALGHTGGTATCTAKPVCTRCNTAYGSALGHTTPSSYSKSATQHWKVCGRGCGTIVVAKANHSNVTHQTVAPTCTTNGTLSVDCSVCGYHGTQTIAKLGHSWTTVSVGSGGATKKVCSRCGASG